MIAEAEEEAEDEEPAPRAFFGARGGGWEEEERFDAPGLREECFFLPLTPCFLL